MLSAEILYKRLSEDMTALERDIDQHVDIEDRAIAPLLSAGAFIDFAHRVGSVVDSLPLIKKRTPEMR